MKAGRGMMALAPIAWSMGLVIAQDQHPSLPKTPTSYETRDAGGEAEGQATVRKEERETRKLTFTAVTGTRGWTDLNGKVIRARLLAFEAVDGEEPLLVKEGKIRLLVDGAKRFSLLPLEKLAAADRTYIADLAAARQREAASR